MRVASVAEAQHDILASVRLQPPLRVPIADALGHVLAEDLIAPISLPPWTNAAMDGYAARSVDVRGANATTPVTLRVVATIAAGATGDGAGSLGPGEAARIFTGAPVPAGADSVIRQEDSDLGSPTVKIRNDRDAGANVRPAGADLERGARALAGGTPLGPRQLALLAALGVAHPVVHRYPRVGILSTGDEVTTLDHPEDILAGRRLGDANGTALAAMLQLAGATVVPLGIARDEADALLDLVVNAADVDLLVTAGGASVGDHDHVRDVMSRCGVRVVFERVRIRPGGPTVFGVFPDGRAWLALPGNPVSAMVTCELFGVPAVRAMGGHRQPLQSITRVLLHPSVRRDEVLDQYLRCTLTWPDDGGIPLAKLTGSQGSGMLTSMVRADCLVLVPAGTGMTVPEASTAAILLGSHR